MSVWQYIKRGALILFGLAIAVYAGACVYANFIAGDGKPEIPSAEKAQYAVQIKSTGQILLAQKVSDKGQLVTLTGYYEYNGKKFIFRKGTVTLDERLWGPVTVTRRTVMAQ